LSQALLTREISHRVKNSLTSIVGLLRVQARSVQSEDVKNALQDASLRVATIAGVCETNTEHRQYAIERFHGSLHCGLSFILASANHTNSPATNEATF
jgi:two-component sensor histidine kinase